MTYNLIWNIKDRKFSLEEDITETCEDFHWVCRNILQFGRITDKLENKLDYIGPIDKVILDGAIFASIFAKGVSSLLYSKGWIGPGTQVLIASEFADYLIFNKYSDLRRAREHTSNLGYRLNGM